MGDGECEFIAVLPSVFDTDAFLDDIGAFELVEGVSDRATREPRALNYFLLGE